MEAGRKIAEVSSFASRFSKKINWGLFVLGIILLAVFIFSFFAGRHKGGKTLAEIKRKTREIKKETQQIKVQLDEVNAQRDLLIEVQGQQLEESIGILNKLLKMKKENTPLLLDGDRREQVVEQDRKLDRMIQEAKDSILRQEEYIRDHELNREVF